MAGTKELFTDGRRPWYDREGSVRESFVIGVTGGASCGKTALCLEITRNMNIQWALTIGVDSFYKPLTEEQLEHVEDYNFDCPEAVDFEEMVRVVRDLKCGKSALIPQYNYETNKRGVSRKAYGADVILVEGILVFNNPELLELMDIKLFVDLDADVRLARRLKWDVYGRHRSIESSLRQYFRFVKPSFDKYILPYKSMADIIVPRGSGNTVAIDLIVKTVEKKLSDRGWSPVPHPGLHVGNLPPQVHLIRDTPQVRGMQSYLRDVNTPMELRLDFVFYSDRLASLVVEHALSVLPFRPKSIVTPCNVEYIGSEFIAKPIGVSILRGGCAMEGPLRKICKGIRLGKLLIQSNESKIPALIYVKLPKDLKNRHILLLDPLCGSGATVTMAIRVLLDHGVPEDNEVAQRFSKIQIVAAGIDDRLNEKGHIIPGMGYFSDRYFG